MWPRLPARLRAALDQDSAAVHRLSNAQISVAFIHDGDAVTLLLDRRPPEVTESGDATVSIELDADAADAFARGELVVSTALLEGRARATGPVRRYLAVDPVLRGLLRGVA